MILETLLTAALEAGIGLLAEVGFGDALRDLKDRLTNTSERQRREAFERAFTRAREAAGDDSITPLLDPPPFSRRGSHETPRPHQRLRYQGCWRGLARAPATTRPCATPLLYNSGRLFVRR
jgi:hypothetical protein